jgi:hypothetical protein
MPIVMVFRDPKIVNDDIMQRIANKLPYIIANALNVSENPEARLVSDSIKLKIIDPSKFDRNADPLEILIFANEYPERKKDIDKRMVNIADGIKAIWPDAKDKGFVWTQPMGGFAKL